MDSLAKTIRDFIQAQGFEQTYWIAYSGGLDSHVLLHLLSQMRSEFPLQLCAVYINHGLSSSANEWGQHASVVCEKLKINFIEKRITLKSKKENIEEVARNKRYEIFAELLAPNDILLTAHHQDDQAETVLLQLLRGAGPKGLAAMPRIKTFANGFHARPLLDVTRDELRQYAKHHDLHWIEDESNENMSFTRNFLRHEIFSLLKKRWPTISRVLSRSAENCAETQQLIEEITQEDLNVAQGTFPKTLSIKKLMQWNEVRQRQVLRAWLAQLNFPVPNSLKLRQLQQDMLHAQADKSPYFFWKDIEVRRHRDDLYAMKKLSSHNAQQKWSWDLKAPLDLPELGILNVRLLREKTNDKKNLDVTVRFRQGGEKIRLSGRSHHHELKNLFQEWGIPPWLRDRTPLIYVGEVLIAVAGWAVSAEWCEECVFDFVRIV